MRIGILTFHCADNFGAVLQCYALRKYLEKYDANVEIINYTPRHLTGRYGIFPELSEIRNKIKQKGMKYTIKNILWERFCTCRKRLSKKKKFANFRIYYLRIRKRKLRHLSITNNLNYDLVIVGSDQVWNPKSNRGDKAYYLNFVKDPTKKVSYAASIGTDDFSDYTQEMSQYLCDFDLISLRESSFKKIVEKISGKNAEVVLDPVFLIDTNQWMQLTDTVKPFDGKFIFLYCFNKDDQAIDLANKLSAKYDLPIIHFYFGNLRKRLNKDGKCFYFDGPLEFLWYIRYAEFVVTNSFHCTAFSLIFEKEFFSFVFQDRGTRVTDLLEAVNLNERLCIHKDTNEILTDADSIDYKQVKNNIEKLKRSSYSYIDKVISLCD